MVGQVQEVAGSLHLEQCKNRLDRPPDQPMTAGGPSARVDTEFTTKLAGAMSTSDDSNPANAPTGSRFTSEARRGFATVQLTMLSIVVALVLENLLGTLFEFDQWTATHLLQALEVLASSLSMWVGFGLALTVVDKQPSYSDFLNPFLMLIFLSLAVRCIATGNLAGFFFAGALATLSSTINLWGEVRRARSGGQEGPTTIFRLLCITAAIELVAASVMGLGWGGAPAAIGFMVCAIALQAYASNHSIKMWRLATA